MSLLMDALKKAEEEKKQAAKRLQEVEFSAPETTGEHNMSGVEQAIEEEAVSTPELFTETAQLSLEPLPLADKFEETKEAVLVDSSKDSIDEGEVPTVDASEVFSEGLTLENTISHESGSQESGSQETFEETQKVIDLSDTTIIEGLSTENASAPFDDTFHGVLFGGEEQDTEVYEETLPGVPADQLIKDLGGGKFQPTPVAAKTVFSAGNANKKQSSFKWGILVVLALLAAGSFAIFYYFIITPVSRSLPSPLIARGIESTLIVPPAILHSPESEVVTGTIISPAAEKPHSEIFEATIEEQIVVSKNEVSQETLEHVDVVESIPELEVVVEDIASIDKKANDIAIAEVEETLMVDEAAKDEKNAEETLEALPENIQVDSSLISISKNKRLEQENVMVSQAFKAYQEDHYDAAKSIYEGVLKNDPDNRDAHLGLAAIAISNQDRKSAYSHYGHLLNLNPADTIAMNALIGLSGSTDPVQDESAIKLLMQREGEVPYLYFSLGNLYAKQKRWAQAQQAFFNAYRLDATNPDYVLNLAVSLDQMGQYDTALDYYQTAIELSQNLSSRFDAILVRNRILTLSKLIDSKL